MTQEFADVDCLIIIHFGRKPVYTNGPSLEPLPT